ncbi:forkhead box protein N3-like isoform X2 [Cloeon dipterum]|uniref:forkhead box protein N3-like isoform X2 n=1 Tax=Cloeon dipterum TaxID=197152 RepID=UPI0032203DB2
MAPERPGLDDERCTVGTVLLHTKAGAQNADIVKEGDGAAKMFTDVRVGSATQEDDDLTPLSWLQDKNLLRDIPLPGGTICAEGSTEPVEVQIEVREESVSSRADSPTSDYAEESSEHADSSSNSDTPLSPTILQQAMPISPIEQYDQNDVVPQPLTNTNHVHTSLKPPYSFSCLIFMAIEDSVTQKLPVKDIYAWITDHFPYFQTAPNGWKNSVRHNLSLNKCFKKVDKSPNVGKGSLWMVDHCYRPNLLQALKKVPYHPYMQLERFQALNNNNNNTIPNSQSCRLGNVESEPPVVSLVGRSNMLNPDLFPFLTQRLAAAGLQVPGAYTRHHNPPPPPPVHIESQEDVNAATAMLALKHGPRILGGISVLPDRGDHAQKTIPRTHETPQNLVITTSPSADHTYSAGPRSRSTLSPDEAYGEGSSSNESSHGNDSEEDEAEEQRKIAEGADALLNLAGICTAAQQPLKRTPLQSVTEPSAKRGRPPPPATPSRHRASQQQRRRERFHNR